MVTAFLAVGAGLTGSTAVMADGHGDLLGESFVELGGLVADVIFQIGGVQLSLGKIPWKEELSHLVNDIDDGLVGGDGLRADVIKAVFGVPGGDKLLDHRRDLVVQAYVSATILVAGVKGRRAGLFAFG